MIKVYNDKFECMASFDNLEDAEKYIDEMSTMGFIVR